MHPPAASLTRQGCWSPPMSDQIDVSRNSPRPASGALKFHGPGSPRPVLVAAWAILAIFFILPACGEEASDDESTLRPLAASAGWRPQHHGLGGRRLPLHLGAVGADEHEFEARGPMVDAAGFGVGGEPPDPGPGGQESDRIRLSGARSAFVRPQGKGSAVWFGRFGESGRFRRRGHPGHGARTPDEERAARLPAVLPFHPARRLARRRA